VVPSRYVHREVVVGVRDLDQPSAIGFAFEEAALRKAREPGDLRP
jgi:hypothetical protein